MASPAVKKEIKDFKTHRDVYYFYNLTSKWVPQRQVWPFVYGDDAAALTSGFSSSYFCYYMRHNLKLGHYARLSVYMPPLAVGMLSVFTFQKEFISDRVVNPTSCPLCIQIKSVIGQVILGGILPAFAASVASFHYADRLLTYPVPSLVKAPKELFGVWLKLIKANRTVFYMHGAVQVIGAVIVTSQKQLCFAELAEVCFS